MSPVKEALLARHIQQPSGDFRRGVWDCCSWAADWAQMASGRPVGSGLTGRLLTTKEALRIVREGGGMDEVIRKELERNSWKKLPHGEALENGDICTISGENMEKELQVGVGIYRNDKVITIAETGAFRLVAPNLVREAYRWE